MDTPPIIEAKRSAINILMTVALNFLARLFGILIVTFHSWSDFLSPKRVCLLGFVTDAIICLLPYGLDDQYLCRRRQRIGLIPYCYGILHV